jgi:hypothetical protein
MINCSSMIELEFDKRHFTSVKRHDVIESYGQIKARTAAVVKVYY